MAYVQVNIGRNINDEPMNDYVWEMFIGKVRRAIADTVTGWATAHKFIETLNSVEIHRGSGTWDGIVEESAHISLVMDRDLWDVELDMLRTKLRELKRDYDQDSIALIVGSELV